MHVSSSRSSDLAKELNAEEGSVDIPRCTCCCAGAIKDILPCQVQRTQLMINSDGIAKTSPFDVHLWSANHC